MKKLILTLIALLPLAAFSQSFEEGCRAYEQGKYSAAISQWEAILQEGRESGEVYYNLGNAYYRKGDMAKAVLNYERAHRLMPRDKDTRENLALARSKTEDKIAEMPRLFVVRWWQGMVQSFSLRGWMWISIITLALLCAVAVMFFLSRKVGERKAFFVSGSALLLLLVIVGAAAANRAHNVSISSEAIVMSPAAMVKSSPDRGGLDKMVLHEGTKVWVEDRAEGWSKIRISDGNTGWLPEKELEVI